MVDAPRRVLLVSSSGGVLLDLLALEPWWRAHDVSWVAVDAMDTREVLPAGRVTWTREISAEHPLEVLRALRVARDVLRHRRIELLVSAGTGVALPYFVAARIAGVPAWWVETLNVVDRPGLAARLCGRLAQYVVVQHGDQLREHRRALNVGELY